MPDKDILFLLPPGFAANGQREFCPECAEIWGVLSWYPAIKEGLELRYVGIDHPRMPICDLLGEGNWNAPTLIVREHCELAQALGAEQDNGIYHFGSARQISHYFYHLYGTSFPRGFAAKA